MHDLDKCFANVMFSFNKFIFFTFFPEKVSLFIKLEARSEFTIYQPNHNVQISKGQNHQKK